MVKKDKKKLYIGIFIIFIMVSSTVGFIFSFTDHSGTDTSNSIKNFNGHRFTSTNSGWLVSINNRNWIFSFLPGEVNFETEIGSITDKVDVVLLDDTSFQDLSKKFALVGVVVNRISLENVDCSSQFTNLVFGSGDFHKIYKEDNCVYFEGDNNRLIDRLFYHILGVL